jgi:tripartite-type tricarboxylate transporter receptor subunit TctC
LLFMAAVDRKLTQVPFRGGGPVLQALLANQVDLGCEQATTAAPQLQSKSIKGYAVTSAQRIPALPDLPTVGEGGLPNLEISVWHGLFVPSKTPDAVVQTLSAALAKALQDPTLSKRFVDISTVPTPEKATPQTLAQTLKDDIGRWRPLIQAAGQFAD